MYPLLKSPRKIYIQPSSSKVIKIVDGVEQPMEVNDTASEILSLCDGSNSIEDMANELSIKYSEEYKTAYDLICEFINESKDIGTITCSSDKEKHSVVVKGSREYWTPEVISIELTYSCPLYCKHCYRECDSTRNDYIDLEMITQLSEEMSTMGINNVQLTGGEALIHPKFNEIVNCFVEKGINIVLITSGYYYNDEIIETIKKISRNNGGIQISVDGLHNVHNNIRRRKDAFDKTDKFIKTLIASDVNVVVATCVIDQSKEELYNLSSYLKEIGVKAHRFGLIVDQGRSKETKLASNMEEIRFIKNLTEELNSELSDENYYVLVDSEVEHKLVDSEVENKLEKSNCGAGYIMLRISPNLDVHPCTMMNLPLINLKENTIRDYIKKYSSSFGNVNTPNKQSCKECSHEEVCIGCSAQGLINKSKVNECKWSIEGGKELNALMCNL